MDSIKVYSKTGEEKFVVGGIEYHDEWMGQESVTVTLTSSEPMDIAIGDWLVYRGLVYSIYNIPSVLKKARRGSYGESFRYENVKFESRSTELTEIRMLDYVLVNDDVNVNSNTLHYSSLPTFSFYCADIDDFADRMQANTDRWCQLNGLSGASSWLWLTPSSDRSLSRCLDEGLRAIAATLWDDAYGNVNDDDNDDEGTITNGGSGRVNQNVSVSNQSVWEVCSEIKDTFGLNFTMRGRVCYIGAPGIAANHVFKYGKGNGLYEIERVADDDQQVVTKLYAYGSDKNMPIRYYANLNVACYGNATSLVHYICETNILWRSSLFTIPMSEVIGDEVETESYYVKIRFRSHGTDYEGFVAAYERNDVVALAFNDAFPEDSIELMTQIWFESGIDVDKWPDNRKEYTTENLPNNMALNVLMLPGFPNQSLYDWVVSHGGTVTNDDNDNDDGNDNVGLATWRGHTAWFSKDELQPYILSENYATLGIKEGVKKFDGSDDTDEIYPTIEGMTDASGNAVDEIFSAETIKDNGVFGEGDTTPKTFTITLPSFGSGFDLKELFATGENVTIAMKDGYCGGREFDVKSVAAQNNGGTVIWKCTCDRDHDDLLDLYFPYSYSMAGGGSAEDVTASEPYQVRAGDKYVLTGIKMTDAYVEAASVRLLEAALTFLEANDYTRFTYLPKVDEIFMARDQFNDNDNERRRSLHDALKAGMLMLFKDEDLRIDGSVYIDTLTIREDGNNGIPTYDVTLRNDKQVGTIQRIENKVDSITSTGGVGMGTSIPAIRSLIEAYGREYFLSRTGDDTARGVINFLEWLRVKNVPLTDWFVSAVTDDTVNGLITFVQGLQSSGYESGLAGSGFALKIGSDGKSRLEVDDLVIRHLLEASEINIHKKSYTSGYQSFGNASGKVYRVETVTDAGDNVIGYKLWFVRSDDTESVKNDWRVGDMAACETFNLVKVESGTESYRNRRWWRLVTETGTGYLDSEEYNYIVVSDVYGMVNVNGNDNGTISAWGKSSSSDSEPAIGDDVVQQGSVSDTSRQNLYVIAVNAATESNEAGHWIYKGIGSDLTSAATQYNLSNHMWSKETTHEVILRADRFYLTTDTGVDEELKSTTRYYLELTPSVINRSTYNAQTFNIKGWKQNGTEPPVGLTSADGFMISTTISGSSQYTDAGKYDVPWNPSYIYGDFVLKKLINGSWQEYDRVALGFVENGEKGDDGTSFTVKGFAQGYTEDYSSIQSSSFISYFSEGDLIIVNDGSNSGLYELHSGQWRRVTISTGDAYKQNGSDYNYYGHIFCWNGSAWLDLGQISGQDGKDAGVFRVDKETIVVEETSKDDNVPTYDKESETISVVGYVGNTNITSSTTIGSPTCGGIVKVAGVSVDNTLKQVVVTLSSALESTGREGYINIPCSATVNGVSYSQTLRVNVYVNRVGTWRMEIEGETAQSISEAKVWVTGQGFVSRSTAITQDSQSITLGALLDGLWKSSLTIDGSGYLRMTADKAIQITTEFIEALNAVLTAKSLVSDNSNGLRVEIEDGLLVVKYNDVVRIALGLQGENPVLTFYDTLGNYLYDLGPNGISARTSQDARVYVWPLSFKDKYGVVFPVEWQDMTSYDVFLGLQISRYWNDIWGSGSETTIYQPYLKITTGVMSYPTGLWNYSNHDTGATGQMSIKNTSTYVVSRYDKSWISSAEINDGGSNILEGIWIVGGENEWSYGGVSAPTDYLDNEHNYPDDERISVWDENVKYRRFAIIKDGYLLYEMNVYRRN